MNNEKLIISLMKKFGCGRADAIDWAQDIARCSSEPNGRLSKFEEINEAVTKTYACECLKCGWATTSTKHCDTFKCEKCGGTMRRKERPGPGKEDATSELSEAVRLSVRAKAGLKTYSEPENDEFKARQRYRAGVRT